MGALPGVVVVVDFLTNSHVVIPERHRLGGGAVREIVEHEHDIGIAVLFAVVADGNQAVSLFVSEAMGRLHSHF